MKDLVRFHDEFKCIWDYFVILSSSSSLSLYHFYSSKPYLPFLFSLSLLSGFLTLSLWALSLCLSVSGLLSVSFGLCYPSDLFSLVNWCMARQLCLTGPPTPPRPPVGCFLYRFLNLSLWVYIPLFRWVSTHLTLFLFEYLILSKFLYGFSPVLSLPHFVSWYLFSLELLLLPFSKI